MKDKEHEEPMVYRCISNLPTFIYEERTAMGKDAANMVCQKIDTLLSRQQFVNMIFAAAPSQNEFLTALTQYNTNDWKYVNAFHMDEYIGLPENDPRTFASFLKEKIFDKLPFNSVNYINGNAADPEAECRRYAELLANHPPDIVCMGIGENGHIAFNDPHVADFNDPAQVKVVSLDTECRQQQVNDKCFEALDDVPTHALTLTVPALMAGRYIYCMVPGEKKAKAVFNTLHVEITEKCPATILRKHISAALFLDKDSGRLL
ncbi:glucosamine-6-phosphate deaminase [Mucilaginibacter sp.]|uniref:glucosamine-6-phosphate deaminase n=1 Tax=Mucilaginibacter sp. TaxID=1882438 RepID=UPI0026115560|nr:glucosamine-6-phosphate deaminase [Mucilaginibacter sp.]MDB4919339.1 glucosamine-6-phosphate deaminase [Mucilaginibacter sp.]